MATNPLSGISAFSTFLFGAFLPGCATSFEVHDPLMNFDAIVIPGCPTEGDGRLTRCQLSRAVWATLLWERQTTTRFIVSGGAVHTPYVEAEAIAEAMTALGVPADHIHLESEALHTDENMWNAIHIARALGYRRLAVASHAGHGSWGCRLMLNWGQPCWALPMDEKAVGARVARHEAALLSVRPQRQASWIPLDEKERRRARLTGRRVRPPSFLVYPGISILKFFGTTWIPHGPEKPALVTWAERSAELHSMGLETPPTAMKQRRD